VNDKDEWQEQCSLKSSASEIASEKREENRTEVKKSEQQVEHVWTTLLMYPSLGSKRGIVLRGN